MSDYFAELVSHGFMQVWADNFDESQFGGCANHQTPVALPGVQPPKCFQGFSGLDDAFPGERNSANRKGAFADAISVIHEPESESARTEQLQSNIRQDFFLVGIEEHAKLREPGVTDSMEPMSF